jgi:hypothetical protein
MGEVGCGAFCPSMGRAASHPPWRVGFSFSRGSWMIRVRRVHGCTEPPDLPFLFTKKEKAKKPGKQGRQAILRTSGDVENELDKESIRSLLLRVLEMQKEILNLLKKKA